MYTGVGHCTSGYVCPGTDEVCFSYGSSITPHASPQRPGKHHRVKSVPQGCAACIGKCRSKEFGVLPQQAFCSAKVAVVYTSALLAGTMSSMKQKQFHQRRLYGGADFQNIVILKYELGLKVAKLLAWFPFRNY